MPPVNNQPWAIECRCMWCGESFVRMEIDQVRAWVCPTETCRERQLQWKRVDLAGKLFYLPMPIQVELHEAVASRQYGAICMGGHRGSSKSIAIRNEVYSQCLNEAFDDFTVLFFRRELGELELNQWRFFEREVPRIGGKYAPKKVTFESTNAEIRPAHSNNPRDFEKYIGGDVDLIVLEQIEEFLQTQVVEINAATGRSTRLETWRGLLLATENPGGPLSDFVNQIFVRKDLDKQRYPHYNPRDYHFIEARLEDNPWTDARYEQRLAILSPARREMFRHGRRDVFEHQFFPDWIPDAHLTDDVSTRGAAWFGSMRYGFNEPGCFLLWAVLPDRRLYIRKAVRLEGLNEEALVPTLLAECRDAGIGLVPLTYLSPKCFAPQTDQGRLVGQTIGETLQYYGLSVVPGDPDLLNGWKRCHALLRDSPLKTPWLRVHASCTDLVHAISTAMSDEKDADVLNPESPGRTALEAFRLGAMARPEPGSRTVVVDYPEDSAGWLLQRAIREAAGQRIH